MSENKMQATTYNRYAQFQELFTKAGEAGMLAGKQAIPEPMIVKYRAMGEPRLDFISEGMCGFAWVTVRPGNCSFANWLKKKGYASKAYKGGVSIWISQFGQSITRKEAYARAVADVLQEAGVNAIAGSRLD